MAFEIKTSRMIIYSSLLQFSYDRLVQQLTENCLRNS